MKHKTSELTGGLLNLAVHKAREAAGYETLTAGLPQLIAYSTHWSIGGTIIDRERIHLTPVDAGGTFLGAKQERDGWLARCTESFMNERGDTPLIAAMRAFVAHKLGEEVDL